MGEAGRPLRPRRESGLRRSLQEFLAVPLTMVLAFIVLAIITSVLDRANGAWLLPVEHVLSKVAPPKENQAMLRTIGPGVLTLMTITFFLLLTLVHRMADVFTWVVVEQFLRRRANQAFFGYFAGLSAYYVIVVAVVTPDNAVFSTVVALVLSVLALVGLVIFGYLVLDQLRPPSVVERIVQHTLATRAAQLNRMRHLRPEPLLADFPTTTVRAECSGYLVDIDLGALGRAVTAAKGEVEIELLAGLGSHTVVGRELAAVRGKDAAERERLADAVLDALRCGRERQLDREPVYGVHQLSSIGWAAATERDPEAALIAVDGLHTLLAEWARERPPVNRPDEDGDPLPLVYCDTTIAEVLSSLASIAVAAGCGGQHQTCAQVLDVFAMALPRLSPDAQRVAVAQVRRAVTTTSTYPLTVELDRALTRLTDALLDIGYPDFAQELSRIESRLDNELPAGPLKAHD